MRTLLLHIYLHTLTLRNINTLFQYKLMRIVMFEFSSVLSFEISWVSLDRSISFKTCRQIWKEKFALWPAPQRESEKELLFSSEPPELKFTSQVWTSKKQKPKLKNKFQIKFIEDIVPWNNTKT